MLRHLRTCHARNYALRNRTLLETLEPRVPLAADAAKTPLSSYIVMLNDDAGSPAAEAAQIAKELGGKVGHVYQHAFKGFSLELPDAAVQGLKKHSKVRSINLDGTAQILAQTLPPGINRVE